MHKLTIPSSDLMMQRKCTLTYNVSLVNFKYKTITFLFYFIFFLILHFFFTLTFFFYSYIFLFTLTFLFLVCSVLQLDRSTERSRVSNLSLFSYRSLQYVDAHGAPTSPGYDLVSLKSRSKYLTYIDYLFILF